VATARFMGGREFASIAGEGEGEAERSVDEAEVLALVERGVLVLPAFAPGGPFPHAKGEALLPSPCTPRERAAAAALYCALVTDVCLDLVGARGDILVEGPFARNPGILGALAALRPQQRVVASSDATGTFAGAARLAAWSRGEAGASAPAGVRIEAPRAARTLLAGHREHWRGRLG
jgi:sugar (pentulose or hexulose) kinase